MIGLPRSDVSLVTSIVLKLLILVAIVGVLLAGSTGGMIVWILFGLVALGILWMFGVRTLGFLEGR